MRKRRVYLILIGVLPLLFFGFALGGVFGTSEPEYGGKRLSEWVDDAGDGTATNYWAKQAAATNAFARIGMEAVPYLLEWMKYEGPPYWKVALDAKLPAKWTEGNSAAWYRREAKAQGAVLALITLAPLTSNAIADLSRLANDSTLRGTRMRAIGVLASLGSAGVPVLIEVLKSRLTNTNTWSEPVQMAAVKIMLGAQVDVNAARSAIPALSNLLNDPDPLIRDAATNAMDAIVMLTARESEPEYGGKRLGAWVEEYSDERVDDRGQAQDAIQHIGTNAMPYLLRWIRIHDEPDPVRDRAWGAARGIGVLGPQANGALPELSRLMADPATATAPVAYALAQIGPEALSPLMAAATNKALADGVRVKAIEGFFCLGTNAHPAVPVLIECLKDASSSVVGEAAWTLGLLHLEPALAVPALTNLFGHSNAMVRLQAARALSGFRGDAVPALAAMQKLLTDPDKGVRKEATNTFRHLTVYKRRIGERSGLNGGRRE